jgi:hypothetical protein
LGWISGSYFFLGGWERVLLGVLRKRAFLMWFFAGENVVDCVVDVVIWQCDFAVRKKCQVIQLFFVSRKNNFDA